MTTPENKKAPAVEAGASANAYRKDSLFRRFVNSDAAWELLIIVNAFAVGLWVTLVVLRLLGEG